MRADGGTGALRAGALRPGGPRLAALLIALLVAFGFQGSRGLWSPDEGRYVHAAQTMLESGDWLVPRVYDRIYLDKPPLHYWSLAAGLAVFGENRWGARLPHALWFLATAAVVGATASSMTGRRAGWRALVLYAVTLLPAVAANVLTPDTPLAFAAALALFAYWRYLGARSRSDRLGTALLLGVAFGLGGLAKGPAILLFAAPLGLHLLIRRGLRGAFAPELWLGAAVAAVLGGSWYLWIARTLPGAADYLFHNQVSGRLWLEDYARNEEWWEPLRRYLPTLLLGMLPGLLFWPRQLLRAREPNGLLARWRRDPALLLGLWVALPLAVLFSASSRLELYVLPLIAPLVIATVLGLELVAETPGVIRRFRLAVLASALFLVVVKGGSGLLVHERDTTALARALEREGYGAQTPIVLFGEKRAGLSLHGYSDVVRTNRVDDHIYFSPPPLLEAELPRLLSRCTPGQPVVFVHGWDDPVDLLEAAGLECLSRPAHEESVKLRICPCPAGPPGATPAP